MAVCFKCGAIKFGAFVPCPDCHAWPQTEDELVTAMAMTDHYFDLATLEQFSAEFRAGKPPCFAPDDRAKLLEHVRSTRMLEQLQGVMGKPDTVAAPSPDPGVVPTDPPTD
jgi:hypothetical protein